MSKNIPGRDCPEQKTARSSRRSKKQTVSVCFIVVEVAEKSRSFSIPANSE